MQKKQKPITAKELTPYENYRELCKQEWRLEEINRIVMPLKKEIRSIAQNRKKYIMSAKQLGE